VFDTSTTFFRGCAQSEDPEKAGMGGKVPPHGGATEVPSQWPCTAAMTALQQVFVEDGPAVPAKRKSNGGLGFIGADKTGHEDSTPCNADGAEFEEKIEVRHATATLQLNSPTGCLVVCSKFSEPWTKITTAKSQSLSSRPPWVGR